MKEIMEMISIDMLDSKGIKELYNNDFNKLLERRDYYYEMQKQYSNMNYWNTYIKLENIVYEM